MTVPSFLQTCMLAVFLVSLIATVSEESQCSNMNLGEDALANLSIERTEAGTITGHVRIRSKTQGIALSLGDKITMGRSWSDHRPFVVF